MDCPYCGEQLYYEDYYGKIKYAEHYYQYPRSWIDKIGDIFRCENEECEKYEQHFFTEKQDNLREGYPC